jgi:hypothetical protein
VVKNSKKKSTYSYTNIRSYPKVEILKKEKFARPFFGLHGGSFQVFLDKHSQGTLGVKHVGPCVTNDELLKISSR